MVGKCKENVIWNRGDTQMDPLRRAERYDAGTDIKNHKVKKQEHTTFRHGKKKFKQRIKTKNQQQTCRNNKTESGRNEERKKGRRRNRQKNMYYSYFCLGYTSNNVFTVNIFPFQFAHLECEYVLAVAMWRIKNCT